jgi:serine/threonine protein kinase
MTESAALALNRALGDIRGRAAAGDLVSVVEYVRQDPVLGEPPQLLELIMADARARCPVGMMPAPTQYAAMFPKHADAICGLFKPDSPPDTPTSEFPAVKYHYLAPPSVPGDLGMLGEYRVVRKVSEGGMGIVFEGYDSFAERVVALKVIRPALADFPNYKSRFREETQAAAKLHHANVISLYYAGEEGRTLFQVMPFLRGESLAAKLARDRTLSVGEIIRLARGVAAGLSAAHKAGLIHRDIKPSNLWLETDGDSWRPLILDFGLVLDLDVQKPDRQATSDGVIIGSIPYMSPEQGKSIDRPVEGRSDLFSLGAVLYEAATGVRVFNRGHTVATIRATADFHPEPLTKARPDLPPPLADLIHAMLAKHPNDRPASASAVVAALDQLGQLSPVDSGRPAAPISGEPPEPRSPRRNRWLVPTAAMGVVVAGIAIAGAAGAFRNDSLARWDEPGKNEKIPPAVPLTATVDMEFVNGPGRTYRGGLRDAHTLPARPGDKVRITVNLSAKAYCYVFAVTSDGKVMPVYPWLRREWGVRTEEKKVDSVLAPPDDPDLPLKQVNVFEIAGSERGMDSIIAVIRNERWELPDEKIQALFSGLEPDHQLANPKAFAAFDNGALVKSPERTRDWNEAAPENAPHLQIQNLIARKLQPHAAFTTAVSFAKVEK